MADSPLTQIRGKTFRQREIDLDQFTDEELYSRYRFARESIKYMVEILENDFDRQTRRKLTLAVANVVTTSCNKVGQYKTWTAYCGLRIEYNDYVIKQCIHGQEQQLTIFL